MFLSVRVLGTGAYLPACRVTSEDLDFRLGLKPGTTLARNGVHTRYFAGEHETASCMSVRAIQQALDASGMSADKLDAIIFSGIMPEQPMPSTAVLIHRRLCPGHAASVCFDINASCTGFLKGFEIAANAIHTGMWRNVAVVATEIASKGLNWKDPDTCTLFGDGSGAAILGPGHDSSGIIVSRSAMISEGAELCTMRAGGSRFNMRTPPKDEIDYLFTMNGRSLLRLIRRELPPFYEALLAEAGGDIALIVPHQASAVGLEYFRRTLAREIPMVEILPECGNQVSASLPIALDHAIRSGRMQRGDKTMLLGTAAGLAMSGLVLRY
jgi:3-oxoacyl-[acyl-carrier-protein] synthase-3